MTNAAPRVSVLIPTFNHGRFLDEAILSLLAQTYADFECIIVDNLSTDNTKEVVAKYLTDSRVSYYCNEINLGSLGNFNKCLEYARGEYIKFLLSDDYFHPHLLEKFVKVLDTFPTVDLVTSCRETFGNENQKLVPPLEGLQEGKKVIVESLKGGRGNWIGEPTTVMIRRSKLPGGFSDMYTALSDLNLWLRLMKNGDCYIVPEVLSYFRIHDAQLSSTLGFGNLLDEYHFYKRIQTDDEYGVDPNEVGIDKTVKSKATKCTRAMFRLLPHIGRKKDRQLFLKAFYIGREERVLIRSIMGLVRLPSLRGRRKALREFLRTWNAR